MEYKIKCEKHGWQPEYVFYPYSNCAACELAPLPDSRTDVKCVVPGHDHMAIDMKGKRSPIFFESRLLGAKRVEIEALRAGKSSAEAEAIADDYYQDWFECPLNYFGDEIGEAFTSVSAFQLRYQ